MGRVSLVKTTQGIKEGLVEALDLIGGLGHYIETRDRVMLKPNLNGLEGYTSRELVEALLQLLLDWGVREVFMGESTFGGVQHTNVFFKKTGFTELAERYGVDLVNLNASEAVVVQVENGLILDRVRVAKEALEADKIINLPNMKVHYATGVSLALKNMKGVLVGDEKRRFHEVGLDRAIADLNHTVRPHLNIVDCISCMERMGPRGGDVVDLDLIMAGGDSAEVDCVGCAIMGYGVSEVRHLEHYIDVNGLDPNGIAVVGAAIEAVRYPFKKVQLEGVVPEGLKIHNRDACSSCMNALLLSCGVLQGDLKERVDVYLGSSVEADDAPGIKVAFGNCCPEDMAVDKRIKGCPPYPFALRDCLSPYLK